MTTSGEGSGRDRPAWGKVAGGLVLFGIAFVLLYVADGSRQPTSGPGWTLLGYQRAVAGPADVVALSDPASLAGAWDKLRLPGVPPRLDSARVYWFTASGTIGCPSHLAGVDVDGVSHRVVAVFTRALTLGCDPHRVPDSFLVAIDRGRLPAPPFDVRLIQSSDSSQGQLAGRSTTADLREPAARRP